jgi:flagellar hook-associated protein 3 FlgL
MTRVSNFAQSEAMMAEVLKVQQRLLDSQRQVVTGKNAEFYKDIPRDSVVLLGAKTVENRTIQYQRTGIELTRKLKIYDVQANELANVAVDLRQEVITAAASTSGLSIMDRVEALFAQATRVLNTTLDGNYLFGGTRTDAPPVNIGTLTELIALPVVSDAFDNTQTRLAAQADDTFTMVYGVLADQSGEPLFSAIKRIAEFNAGPDGPFSPQLTEAQRDFLLGELPNLIQVIDGLQLEVAQVGTDQQVLEEITVRHQETIDFTRIFISDIEDADAAQAISNLNRDQLALEGSFRVLAQINRLSLLDFI